MKIIEIVFNDILQSPEDCSALLNKACCERQQSYKVVGCVSNDDTVFITLEPGETEYEYHFSQFPSLATAEIVAEINSRDTAGFTTVGSFAVGEKLWGLFAK
jgi:hypothetical protein